MTDLVVHPLENPLVGSVPVPCDKSIGAPRPPVRVALRRQCPSIRGFSHGEDNVSTANALRAMGATDRGRAPGELARQGHRPLRPAGAERRPRLRQLRARRCASSRACSRRSASQSTLIGRRVALAPADAARREPLRARGARHRGQADPKKAGEITPPLVVGPLPDGT